MPRSADPTIPPVRIDGFDELRLIGRGGFSYVFSARQRDFNRRVALKVLTFGLADERERRSFERECRAMGLVSQHPHIVTVFNAAFTASKQPCIVMELYSGGTVGDRLKQGGALPAADVLDIGVKISGALQTAHDRGLLHCDIKPQNLFMSEFGEPALGDFGISTLDDERSISGGAGLTVHYAPPEVLEGAAATAISDVYSLGATLYTLVDGARPFAPAEGVKQSIGELARRIVLDPPPRTRRAGVSRELADLLARTMSKRPEDRPGSAGAFGEELRRIQAQLGLPMTALPVATREVSSDLPSGSVPGSPLSVVPPPPGGPVGRFPSPDVAGGASPPARHEAHGVDEPGHTATVARPVARHDEPPPAPVDDSPTNRRIVIGTVAGVLCLLLVAGLLVLAGRGGDDDEQDPSADTVTATTQLVQLRLPAPTSVAVARGEQPDQVVVTWAAVGQAESGVTYQVEPRTTGLDPVRTEQLSATFSGVAPDAEPCFTVVAITADGQIGTETDLACL